MARPISHLTADEKHRFFELMVHFLEERRIDVLEDIFNIYDRDHDKTICADELRVTVQDLSGSEEVEGIVQGILDAADTDHDGQIHLNEFIEAMKKLIPS
jgi:Ca2+-binding EF-hand superfamily protein